jgi:hypothetical protein
MAVYLIPVVIQREGYVILEEIRAFPAPMK